MSPQITPICRDCGCVEGELHKPGCFQERCPFCGGQLVTCDCIYEKLAIADPSKYGPETAHLPPRTYRHGPTQKQLKRWDTMLRRKGLVPYIAWPLLCAHCGTACTEIFIVSSSDWKRYIQPDQRHKVICLPCYRKIKLLIDKAALKRGETLPPTDTES
jgi:hypothetical protein